MDGGEESQVVEKILAGRSIHICFESVGARSATSMMTVWRSQDNNTAERALQAVCLGEKITFSSVAITEESVVHCCTD